MKKKSKILKTFKCPHLPGVNGVFLLEGVWRHAVAKHPDIVELGKTFEQALQRTIEGKDTKVYLTKTYERPKGKERSKEVPAIMLESGQLATVTPKAPYVRVIIGLLCEERHEGMLRIKTVYKSEHRYGSATKDDLTNYLPCIEWDSI